MSDIVSVGSDGRFDCDVSKPCTECGAAVGTPCATAACGTWYEKGKTPRGGATRNVKWKKGKR